MTAYIKRSERYQINDLMLHLKHLEKQEQANPKTSRRREIIKIRAEINEIETKKLEEKKHKSVKSEMQKGRDNIKYYGDPENHQRLF
jgi:hypothetical protein